PPGRGAHGPHPRQRRETLAAGGRPPAASHRGAAAMTRPGDLSTDDDPRVLDAARDYLAELEAGRRPDRQAYLGRHPEVAAELAECLDGIDLAHGAGLALAASAAPEFQPDPLGDFQILREIGRGGMGIVYEAVQRSL